MIYELRVYDVVPGKLPALLDRFQNFTTKGWPKYDLKLVGFWTDEVGASNRLTYILAFEDMAQRDKAWAAWRADPDRARVFAETEKERPLVARVQNTIMPTTAFSPMQ